MACPASKSESLDTESKVRNVGSSRPSNSSITIKSNPALTDRNWLPLIAIMLLVGCFLLLLSTFGAPSPPSSGVPTVKTKQGLVAGYVKSVQDKGDVYVYEGIRYGKPPVGDLRFQKPQPAEPWEGVYNATHYRTACYQPLQIYPDNNVPETTHRSEDCLFLTVRRPARDPPSGTKYPVMFWVHGGGFETGSIFSIAYDSRYIVSYGEVVVVTVNYRLGPFGFLFGDTDDSQGNNGLHDQILALKWVQDNIEAFGGDTKRVTIFGESAGGMSVGGLLLSPLAKGLFQRVISQSGAPNSYLGSESKEKSTIKTKAVAERLNCSITDNQEMMKCLRSVTPQQILDANPNARTNGETFIPIFGDALLPIQPSKAINGQKWNEGLDVMFGTVGEEGALFVESLFPDRLSPDIKEPNLSVSDTKKLIELLYFTFRETYGTEVAEFYAKGIKEKDYDAMRLAIARAFGDYHLVCPTIFLGQYYAKYNPGKQAFAYRVIHSPKVSVFPSAKGWMGTVHGDDVVFLFGFPIMLTPIVYSEEDYQQSIDMIAAWTNFAKTGNPGKVGGTVEWREAIDKKHLDVVSPPVSYLALNATHHSMVDNYYVEICDKFWKSKILV